MNNNIEYIHSFANTSITLRVIEYLRSKYQIYLNSVTVINQIDRWIVKVSLKKSLPLELRKNLQAFLDEMGVVAQLSTDILDVFTSLERGESPIDVMNRYQIVIVVYGKPETEEIEIFRQQIVDRLGYCPQNMA